MIKIRNSLFIILLLLHAWILFFYGIAAPSTTLLWYLLIYYLGRKLISFFSNPDRLKRIQFQWKLLCSLMLALEYILLWLVPVVNQQEENQYSLYLSGYKRAQQIQLLNTFSSSPRLSGWEYGYQPLSSSIQQSDEFQYTAHYNASGLRNQPSLPIDTTAPIFLVLGDSFSEGFGAPDDSTFPAQLAKYMPDREVINAGICGSNPLMAIRLYNNRLQQIRTKEVVLVLNLTDVKDIEYTLHPNNLPPTEYLLAMSRIYRFINAGIFNNQIDILSANTFISQRRNDNIRQLMDTLQTFNRQLLDKGITLTLVYLPIKEELMNKELDVATNWLLKPLQQTGIPLINLKALYADALKNKQETLFQWYWPKDGHHTPYGYNQMAKITIKALQENKTIPQK